MKDIANHTLRRITVILIILMLLSILRRVTVILVITILIAIATVLGFRV